MLMLTLSKLNSLNKMNLKNHLILVIYKAVGRLARRAKLLAAGELNATEVNGGRSRAEWNPVSIVANGQAANVV